jgi:hypothetical protein
MCPMCVAAAALIAGKVTLAGGLAAVGIKKFGVKNAVNRLPDTDGAEHVVPNSNQRRDPYANDCDSER